jgi:aminoglycoside phosphotransferase (APT) family kinase protein
LCHFDLHYGNLLFDDQYNLTGVIDWSQAATAPLERLAVSPEFITFPAIPDNENQVIVNFREATRDCLQEPVNKAVANITGK